jgi:1,4-alpha-glucan branching enzyme
MPAKKKDKVRKQKHSNEPDQSKLTDPGNDNRETYEEKHFIDTSKPVWNFSLLTEDDVSNYQQGTHYQLYKKFGSHSLQVNDIWGMYFCVWAPNASSVSVKGHFNNWKDREYELFPRWDKSGIWEGFIPGFNLGEAYKYHIVGYAF